MGDTAHRLEGERASHGGEHLRVIEDASSVLQEIRAVVLERFNSLPHGGGAHWVQRLNLIIDGDTE